MRGALPMRGAQQGQPKGPGMPTEHSLRAATGGDGMERLGGVISGVDAGACTLGTMNAIHCRANRIPLKQHFTPPAPNNLGPCRALAC